MVAHNVFALIPQISEDHREKARRVMLELGGTGLEKPEVLLQAYTAVLLKDLLTEVRQITHWDSEPNRG